MENLSFSYNFVADVKDRVIANNGPIQVQLVVSFKNNTGIDKVAYKNIKVQDDFCGCPAQVPVAIHPSGWLTFQCHNLGADYDIRSDAELMNINATNFREYHGDWYRFGAKNVSLVNNGAYEGNSTVPNWTVNSNSNYPFQDAGSNPNDWIATNDPCPVGWRLPKRDEWQAVIDNNTPTWYVNGSATTNGWIANNDAVPTSGYNDVVKLGDYLYLPTAGMRNYDDGRLYNRGNTGHYWTRTTNSTVAGYTLQVQKTPPAEGSGARSFGYSVRCVSVE